jgi:hypothetical protein
VGTEPVITNPVATFLNTVVGGLLTGITAPAIDLAAEAAFPLLGFPIIKEIFEYAIKELAGQISINIQDGIVSIVINIETNSELHNLLSVLAAVNAAHKSGNANDIAKAIDDAGTAWDNLGHFDGIAVPK